MTFTTHSLHGTARRPERWRRRFAAAAPSVALAVALGLVYRATMLGGVGFSGDTAKFQYIGKVLGTPHEPGYPIYLLLSNVWIHLFPIGSIAWRVNALSILFAILACVAFQRSLPTTSRATAACAAACLGFTRQFWTHAIVAEVYALLMLFLAVVTLAIWTGVRREDPRWIALGFGAWGIALGHHPLIVTAFPAAVLAVASRTPSLLRSRQVGWALFAGMVIGLGSYSYLRLRTLDPSTAHLEIRAESFSDVVDLATGGRFRGRLLTESSPWVSLERLGGLAKVLAGEIGVLLPFVLLGARRLTRLVAIYASVVLAGTLFLCVAYDIPDIEVYLLPAAFAVVAMSAPGIDVAARGLRRVHTAAPWILWLGLPTVLLVANLHRVDRSGDHALEQRARAVLSQVESQAVVWEPNYARAQALWYFTQAEELQRTQQIYVIRTTSARAVHQYLQNDADLRIVQQRRNVPSGLRVFVLSHEHAARLEGLGARVERVGDEIYRVRNPPSGGSTPEPISPRAGTRLW